MTPEARRDASNSLLSRQGVPVAASLPLIEKEEEVSTRDPEAILRRLVALWAVAGAANLPDTDFFRDYISTRNLHDWLSHSEREFLFASQPDEAQRIHFSWQVEPLYFLSWCAGLIPEIALPKEHSDLGAILGIFPRPDAQDHARLSSVLRVRAKSELLDWADLLYRAHWAVRDAQLRGLSTPAGLVGGAVMEWHKAINWITCYEGEEDWDNVATDT